MPTDLPCDTPETSLTRQPLDLHAGQRHRSHKTMPYALSALLVMLLAMVISLVGLRASPIEGHEIFVVQTAREMLSRGEWVVPWFNQEPRLNKPPLNYWLTAGVCILAQDKDVEAWHGRMVSTAGGLLIVAMVLWTGCLLGSSSISITAGLLAATSVGYLMFTNDGRPDMLYAGLCTAMLPLWLCAWKHLKLKQLNRANLATYGLWLALALATLSKGPHIPLLFLAIFIAITWYRDRSFKQCFQIFRPITGAMLAVVLVAPWWLALYSRIGNDLFQSQLAGKRYNMDLQSMADPYYLYRTFIVILPWCLLWCFGVLALLKKNARGQSARLLFAIVAVTLVALSLATGKRLVYVLPLLAPLSLLLAMGAEQLVIAVRQNPGVAHHFRFWHTFIYAVVTVLLIIITSVRHAHRLSAEGLLWIPAVGIVGAIITAFVVVYLSKPARHPLTGLISPWQTQAHGAATTIRGAAVIFAWFLIVATAAATTDNPSRWMYQDSSDFVVQNLPADQPLYTIGVSNEPYIYFTNRAVHELKTIEELQQAMDQFPQGLYLISPSKTVARLKTTAGPMRTTEMYNSTQSPLALLHIAQPSAFSLRTDLRQEIHPSLSIGVRAE